MMFSDMLYMFVVRYVSPSGPICFKVPDVDYGALELFFVCFSFVNFVFRPNELGCGPLFYQQKIARIIRT